MSERTDIPRLNTDGAALERLRVIGATQLRHMLKALLREWSPDVAVSPRGEFVDFRVGTIGALGLSHNRRFRLYLREASSGDLIQLDEEAKAVGLEPVAVVPRGSEPDLNVPIGVRVVGPASFLELCKESGVLVEEGDQVCPDKEALRELHDNADASLAHLNGLLWLRPLSRDRCPPQLRWTRIPAHELFERCFFLTCTSTFQARGTSWGTKDRGRPFPDGGLRFPGVDGPVLYDCKASRAGYSMSMPDLRTAADYLSTPPSEDWRSAPDESPRFLVVSSKIRAGAREASHSGRQAALDKRISGAKLTWIRIPDLVRFGLALERAELPSAVRESIHWTEILDDGDVSWETFNNQLLKLRSDGHDVSGDA